MMDNQIIIDGVDVSGCKFYSTKTGYCLQNKNLICNCTDDANYNLNCYYKQLKAKEQECEKLKNTVMQKCPQCGEVYLNPIGCELYEQLDQLESKNKELEEANDEKNELLAQLGCPTIATARRLALTLKEQLKAKEEECKMWKLKATSLAHADEICALEIDLAHAQDKYKEIKERCSKLEKQNSELIYEATNIKNELKQLQKQQNDSFWGRACSRLQKQCKKLEQENKDLKNKS